MGNCAKLRTNIFLACCFIFLGSFLGGSWNHPAFAEDIETLEKTISPLAFDSAISRYNKGDYQGALATLKELHHEGGALPVTVRFLLADAYQKIQAPRQALEVLKTIDQEAFKGSSIEAFPDIHAQFLTRVGSLHLQLGELSAAATALTRGITVAKQLGNGLFEAALLNELGLLYFAQGDETHANDTFDQANQRIGDSFGLDSKHSDKPVLAGKQFDEQDLALRIAFNQTGLALDVSPPSVIQGRIKRVGELLMAYPDNEEKVRLFLSLGHLQKRVYEEDLQRPGDLPALVAAHHSYQRGLKLSVSLANKELESYALGAIALLYEKEQRCNEAMIIANQALLAAALAESPNSMYQWEWLLGRCKNEQGKLADAANAYQRSIEVFRPLRERLVESRTDSYQKVIQPLFIQFADIKLQLVETIDSFEDQKAMLFSVRDTLEELRQAEVEDYFENQCIAPHSNLHLKDSRYLLTSQEKISASTAYLYPLMLPDRIELLIVYPEGIRRFASVASATKVTQVVREFRLHIEVETGTREYLRKAQQLYQWLIAPIEETLADNQIHTVVYVPDGPLRTVPLAALHDGKGYLIQRFAIATQPSLRLVNTESSPKDRAFQVVAGGLSESVQGFAALPFVLEELAAIEEKTKARLYPNQAFQVNTIEKLLGRDDFTIAHFATHGEFNSDHQQSFLLAHDGRFTMSRLQQSLLQRSLLGEPLDLLVLSACQTAAGDDRAALGLAGIAIQAGAKSALASLWSINDEATFRLIKEFYRQLQQVRVSKVDSLRQAQLALLADQRFAHPSHWSPFLLVGNWL